MSKAEKNRMISQASFNINLVSFNMIDVQTIVFNVSFFKLATDMYWCLIGNSGSITSKLSIIVINPGHFLCKNLEGDDFRGFIVAKPTFHHLHLRSAYHSVWSFAILYLLFMSLDKKMHLHKFAPGQIVCKIVTETEESTWINATFAGYLHPQSF